MMMKSKKKKLSYIKHITINKPNLHTKQRPRVNQMKWNEKKRKRQECENFFRSIAAVVVVLVVADD